MKKYPRALYGILESDKFSVFQKKVLKTVCGIPRGTVRSYGWVARKAGNPRAYRAVGSALKKNPYPGTIPCHRVVRSNGTIGGFSRGIKTKKKLLSLEGIDWK